jgi:hypothetical protein
MWFGWLDLRWALGARKSKLVVQGLPRAFGIDWVPICNKGTATMDTGVLVTDHGDVLQRSIGIKGGEDVLFIHGFGDLVFVQEK